MGAGSGVLGVEEREGAEKWDVEDQSVGVGGGLGGSRVWRSGELGREERGAGC